jgi:hypothetical protein
VLGVLTAGEATVNSTGVEAHPVPADDMIADLMDKLVELLLGLRPICDDDLSPEARQAVPALAKPCTQLSLKWSKCSGTNAWHGLIRQVR